MKERWLLWFVNTDKVININAGAISYSFPVVEGIQAVNPEVIRLWHHRGRQIERQIEGRTGDSQRETAVCIKLCVWHKNFSLCCAVWPSIKIYKKKKCNWFKLCDRIYGCHYSSKFLTEHLCLQNKFATVTHISIMLPRLESKPQAPGCQALVGVAALPLQYVSNCVEHMNEVIKKVSRNHQVWCNLNFFFLCFFAFL